MDIPLIRKFACGYVQGVKAAKKDAEVFQNMTGTTGAAWNDPVKGGELAKSQIDRGADVIYHAAGGTGIGVLRAAADAGKLGIGVDSNQNALHPGKVLTSMLKRVDIAAYTPSRRRKDGTWKAGVSVLGLKEDGVGWALDEQQQGADHARDEGRRRQGRGGHQVRHDQGARLHGRLEVPGVRLSQPSRWRGEAPVGPDALRARCAAASPRPR